MVLPGVWLVVPRCCLGNWIAVVVEREMVQML